MDMLAKEFATLSDREVAPPEPQSEEEQAVASKHLAPCINISSVIDAANQATQRENDDPAAARHERQRGVYRSNRGENHSRSYSRHQYLKVTSRDPEKLGT